MLSHLALSSLRAAAPRGLVASAHRLVARSLVSARQSDEFNVAVANKSSMEPVGGNGGQQQWAKRHMEIASITETDEAFQGMHDAILGSKVFCEHHLDGEHDLEDLVSENLFLSTSAPYIVPCASWALVHLSLSLFARVPCKTHTSIR